MKHDTASWIESLARWGYAAKGIVYVTVGFLATLAAFNMGGGKTTDSSGALQTIAQQSYGKLLLGVVAIGLIGYVLWRFVQTIMDPEHSNSTGMKGIVRRIGYAVNGIAYAGVALTAIQLAMGNSNQSGSGDSTQAWVSKIMSQPFGEWLVGTGGAFMIGLGFYYFYRAFTDKFREKLKLRQMSQTERVWATRIGRLGISARGIVFCIIGGFLIQAARQTNPSEVRSSEGALQALQQNQPYGSILFIFVALGLIAYGVHMLVQARYRRIRPT